MSNVNKALAVLAALAFFLPFVSFSCSTSGLAGITGNRAAPSFSVNVSGEKLVQCYLSPCSFKDFLPSTLGPFAQYIPDNEMPDSAKIGGRDGKDVGLNFLLFAAIAALVAVIVLFFNARGGELLSGLGSVGVIVLLFMFRNKFGDAVAPLLNSPEVKAAGSLVQIQVQYAMGFWACAVISGVSALLAFKGNLGARAPVVSTSGSGGGYVPLQQTGAPPSNESLAVCSACGSVNSAASKFCLSCGAAVAAAPPAQPGPSCPSCGSSNVGTGKFCLACGASLAAPAVQPAPAAPEKIAAPELQGPVCPSCGSSNVGTGKFCLACGASLAAPAVQPAPAAPEKIAAPEPQGPACPSCGSSNAGLGKFCLACGASLATPEKKAAAPESQGPVCSSCGSTNPGTGKFCLACGGSLMAGVQLFERADASSPPAPVSAPAAAAAPAASAPAVAMAAQASASAPSGQPLRAVAPAPAPEAVVEPPVAPSMVAPVIDEPAKASVEPVPSQPAERQQSLDWTAPPSPAEPQQQVCTSCGTTIGAGQKFCLGCGTPVGQAPSGARTEAPIFTPPPSPEPMQPPAATQIFEPAAKSSSKAWIGVVIAIAALGTGGYFGWQYFTRPDVTVTTNVQRIHVAAGGKTSLEANVSGSSNTDVDWSVQEGAKGGQVTSLGTVMSGGQLRSGALYTAPQTSGTYHVIATSRANSSRSSKVEIIVGGTALPDNTASPTQPTPPSAPTATTSTSPSPTTSPATAFPNAAQIVGTWSGPTADTRTTIGADSSISMSSASNAQNNKSGTYHFTDNTHLDIDFGGGDVRKWEILGFQGAYLRVSEQATSGSSAIIFQKVQ